MNLICEAFVIELAVAHQYHQYLEEAEKKTTKLFQLPAADFFQQRLMHRLLQDCDMFLFHLMKFYCRKSRTNYLIRPNLMWYCWLIRHITWPITLVRA